MKYRYLGSSGLLVSRVCLGTMTYGNEDWGCDGKTAKKITDIFIEAGGTFIDTADMYSEGRSEEMLGAALEGHNRDELVIATKCWFPVGAKGPNAKRLSRKHILEACEASLRRLKLDFIDLYQVHGPDPFTPWEETMRALDDLVRTGKVRYVGCSNLYGWQITKANGVSERMNLERFVSGQYLYNLIRRDVEKEILPACDNEGMGFLCWSPLASGLLTGKYRGKDQPEEGSRIGIRKDIDVPRFWNDASLKLVERVVEIGEKLGKTPPQIALAWLLGDRRVTAPIIGARTEQQARDNVVVGDWDLPEELRTELTEMLRFDLGYPKEWMSLTFKGAFGDEEFDSPRKVRLP